MSQKIRPSFEFFEKETRMTCDIALTRARPSECSFDFEFATTSMPASVAAA